jgi:hypothetical protein
MVQVFAREHFGLGVGMISLLRYICEMVELTARQGLLHRT